MITLGSMIKTKGYTQKFVHGKLKDAGVSTNYTHFNRWCKGFYAPKYDFIYEKLGEILSEEADTIKKCFTNNK